MDRDEFREQITQRYLAGEVMDGASADEIAGGVMDPVGQMDHVTGGSSKSVDGSGPQSHGGCAAALFVLVPVVFMILAILQLLRL